MLTGFYNYYLNSYRPQTLSRYDTHKRSELKNVCKAIININKESPLYMINMTDALQNNIIDIKEHARFLKNAITEISEGEDTGSQRMFNDKIAASSNPDAVSVNYVGDPEDIDDAPLLEIQVEELASEQINKGNYVYARSKALNSDVYSFEVNISNTAYEFQFTVKENETNDSVMKRIAKMINRAEIGIKAEIEPDDTNEKLRFSLTSNSTGTADFSDTLFTISDKNTSKASGSVKAFGLNNTYKFPTDASFNINGIARTSSSNSFTVNKLYELSLNKKTDENETVTVTFQNDKNSTFNKINKFVNVYNSMIQLANDKSSSLRKGSKLLADIGTIAQCYKDELDSMGLNVQHDSSISIDKEKLLETIDKEEAGDGTYAAFRSFKNPLSRKIDNVLLNPMEYVAKTIVTYPNTKHSYPSAYITSIYSGLLYNNYC